MFKDKPLLKILLSTVGGKSATKGPDAHVLRDMTPIDAAISIYHCNGNTRQHERLIECEVTGTGWFMALVEVPRGWAHT